jgi:ATP-binding cassette subfamily C (CFTR/MRP) protein 1
MAVFAALGISQAGLTLCLGFSLAFFNYYASRSLHKQAVHRIVSFFCYMGSDVVQFYAPMSFFDTVPCKMTHVAMSRQSG